MARSRERLNARESIAALLLLAPALSLFAWFSFWPFYRLIHYALYQQNTSGTAERYKGFHQLNETFKAGSPFWDGVRISSTVVLYTVPLGIVLGILMAVAANRRLKGIRAFQTIFSSTVASSVAVSAVVFLTLINPNIGFFRNVSWLDIGDAGSGVLRPALFAVSLSLVWQNLGLTFIIVLAGLQAIPEELNEAATLDGYGPVRRFFRITMPMLSPTLLFVVVVLTIRALQTYAQVQVLTGGGPAGQTETLLFKITRLVEPVDFAKGASMSLGLFVISLIVAGAQFGLLSRRVHYGN